MCVCVCVRERERERKRERDGERETDAAACDVGAADEAKMGGRASTDTTAWWASRARRHPPTRSPRTTDAMIVYRLKGIEGIEGYPC